MKLLCRSRPRLVCLGVGGQHALSLLLLSACASCGRARARCGSMHALPRAPAQHEMGLWRAVHVYVHVPPPSCPRRVPRINPP